MGGEHHFEERCLLIVRMLALVQQPTDVLRLVVIVYALPVTGLHGSASNCAPCTGNTYSGSPSKEACTVCNGDNYVAGKTGSGNGGNDVCQCKAGYGLTDGSCVKCEGK